MSAPADGKTIAIGELRTRLENAKARYAANSPTAFESTIDQLIAAARAQYGDRIPVLEALKLLATIQLPEDAGAAVIAPRDAESAQPPKGMTIEYRPAGFLVRISCRAFITAGLWGIFGAVLIALPFRLWGDQLRDAFTGGLNWMTVLFLAIWFGAVLGILAMCALALVGQIRILKSGDDLEIFTGIGSRGRTRRLRWSDLHGVTDSDVATYSSGRFSHTAHFIAVNSRTGTFKFGSDLNGEQQAFLIAFLCRQVANPGHD